MHPHGPFGIHHVIGDLFARVMHAAHRREIEIAYRDLVILVLLHRLAQRIDLRLILVLCSGGANGCKPSKSEHHRERACRLPKSHDLPPSAAFHCAPQHRIECTVSGALASGISGSNARPHSRFWTSWVRHGARKWPAPPNTGKPARSATRPLNSAQSRSLESRSSSPGSHPLRPPYRHRLCPSGRSPASGARGYTGCRRLYRAYRQPSRDS